MKKLSEVVIVGVIVLGAWIAGAYVYEMLRAPDPCPPCPGSTVQSALKSDGGIKWKSEGNTLFLASDQAYPRIDRWRFHSRIRLCDEGLNGNCHRYSIPVPHWQSPPPDWVERMLGIEGITQVVLYPYMMDVRKARLFTWEELMPEMQEAFRMMYEEEKVDGEVDR